MIPMKSLYTKALCLWTLILLAGLTACRNERDDLPLSERGSRTLRLSGLMPADPTTRVALEEDSEHQVFRARWESGDKLTLIFEQGTQLTSPTEVPVGAIEADGKQAQAEIIVPASINVDEAYTVYAFCGTRGVRVSDKEILMNISPIRALHLKDLSVPVMSKVKVEPSSTSGEVVMDFSHLGSIEYVDLKNSSDTDLKVQGCSLTPINGADEEWRYLPHEDIRYLYKPMSDEVIEATDNGSEIEHPIEEVIIAPGESHTFATWHRPNGNNIPEFTLNMRTNKGTITSTQKKTSKTFAMTPGKAYRVEAEWKDNRLEILGEGVEENVSYITLTPNIEEESIGIGLNAAEEDQSEVWIDLNNNGTMDKGEKVTSFGEKEEYEILYPIRTERITIYGKIFYFSCYKQPMTTLDVTKAPFLVELRCRDNGLTSLDVSQNKLLKELNCDDNPQIKTLDVSQNINLTDLSCANTGLSELDVTKLTKLKDLDCSDNGLTSLDVSQNKALEDLVCNYNKLTTLDVSQNKALTYLYCSDNRIETLDISQNLNLETLHCSDCALTALDASKLSNLTTLDCSFNKIYDLKISASITNLLNCQSCGLSAETLDALFDILPDVSEREDGMKSVRVKGNPGVDDCHPEIATKKGWSVDVKGKPLPPHPKGSRMTLRTEKAVGDKIKLRIFADPKDRSNVWIDLNGNNSKDGGEGVTVFGEGHEYPISSQSITIYGKVTGFDCWGQKVNALDVSENTALQYLNCGENQLSSLDVSKNTELRDLVCYTNKSLSSLKISGSINSRIECKGCNLSAETLNTIFKTLPDVKGMSGLKMLFIYNNPGSDTCDKTIAENKGWLVDPELYPIT